MKILMIAPQPFFEPRGTPISVFQRLQGLSALGHRVDLITYPIGEDLEIPGVKIHRTISFPFIKEVHIGPSWSKLILDILLFFKCLWMLLSKRYDVIHTHEEAAFFALVLAPFSRTAHLYDMHSSLPKQLKNSKFGNIHLIIKLFQKLEAWVLSSCQVVMTIGVDLEEYVLQKFPDANHIRIENIPLLSDKLIVPSYILDLKSRLDLHNRFPIVYTGTFESYQGLGLLFNSASLVLEKHPEVCYVMVGGKPNQIRFWKEKVIKLGLENFVIFVGMVPMEESINYLALAEILVSPRTEGLSVPLKIYSYLYSGKPTVATNIYAHTQILNEEIAIIVDPKPDSYAEGILKLIEDPELRNQIGRQGQIFAEEMLSIEKFLSKLNRAYMAIKYAKPINEISSGQEVSKGATRHP